MEHQPTVFRLYSELETLLQQPLYDVLEIYEGKMKIHRGVHFNALDPALITRIKQSGESIVLIIPIELTREVRLGTIPGSTGKALKAAPFLVEESLPCNLESTHIVFERDPVSKQTSAVVIQHQKIKQCLENFQTEDIKVGRILRDIDTLKRSKLPRIRITCNRTIIETSIERAAISLENTRFYLEAISEQLGATEPGILDVLVTSPKAQRSAALPPPLADMPISYTSDHWFPEQFVLSDACINLAQGKYALENSRLGLRQPHWVFASCLYLSLILLSSAYYGLGEHFARLSQRLSAEHVELYQRLFPQDKKIVNLRAQFAQHLRELEGGLKPDRFTEVFYTVLEQFGKLTNQAKRSVRNVQYQSSPPMLSLEVAIDSPKMLDKLEQQLSAASLSTRIESIAQEGDLFLSHIQVSRGCSKC